MGGDSDTVGAVYGQIAGAYYGVDQIPEEWKEKLTFRPLLVALAEDLYHMSKGSTQIQHQDLYTIFGEMEVAYQPIHRRMNPCPTMFTSVLAFDSAIRDFIEQFQLSTVPGASEILEDYKARFDRQRVTVTRRSARPALSLPFGKK